MDDWLNSSAARAPDCARRRLRRDRRALRPFAAVVPLIVAAQGAVNLPEVRVNSTRVANQTPAATFAMPVSVLHYEPHVELQGRNLAEGQADITIRGGIFESTGLQLGAATIGDPQTGHYLAELPVAPAMLGVPQVVTGAALTLGATNATAGAVRYAWRPLRSMGAAAVFFGEDDLRGGEVHQGLSRSLRSGGSRVGVEMALATSRSDGTVAFGDHDFARTNLRLQHTATGRQTDLFAGYQAKRFGWPNLYTPFNSREAENLQTALFLINHRADFGRGEYFEAAISHRRNKDDYAFDRFAPVGSVHPFQHTTWLNGVAAELQRTWQGIGWEVRAEGLTDKLDSTSLTAGRFRTRTLTKMAIIATKAWATADGGETIVRWGGARNDSNRDGGDLSPVVEWLRQFPAGALKRTRASYTRTSQVPSYTALNASRSTGLFRGNPDLGRSASHNFEFGAEGKFAGWTAEAAVFFRRDVALVDWTFRQGIVARTANPVDVEVRGLEFVARRSWAACDAVIGYTALAKAADYRGAMVDASFYALNYARHRLTLALTVRLDREVEFRLDNAARWQADNPLRTAGGDGALKTAAGLFYRPARLPGWEFSVRIDNVWNDPFQEIPAVPASPRQVAFGIGVSW